MLTDNIIPLKFSSSALIPPDKYTFCQVEFKCLDADFAFSLTSFFSFFKVFPFF